MTTRGRLALLAACGVVAALVALYTAISAPAPTPGPPPGTVRLGPEPGEAVAAYLPRAAATLEDSLSGGGNMQAWSRVSPA